MVTIKAQLHRLALHLLQRFSNGTFELKRGGPDFPPGRYQSLGKFPRSFATLDPYFSIWARGPSVLELLKRFVSSSEGFLADKTYNYVAKPRVDY